MVHITAKASLNSCLRFWDKSIVFLAFHVKIISRIAASPNQYKINIFCVRIHASDVGEREANTYKQTCNSYLV